VERQCGRLSGLAAVMHNRRHAAHPVVPRVMAGKVISCAVVFCRSPGMAIDAAVLRAAIRAFRPDARVVSFELHPRFTKDYATPADIRADLPVSLPFDFVFLLEHAHANPPFLDPAFGRRVVYVPNVEWISPADEKVIAAGAIDTVLLKTRYSAQVFSGLACARNIASRQRFTGWTSVDVGVPGSGERSWGRCLHVCGKSPQKNADAVVAAWLSNPDFPRATVVATAQAGLELSMPLHASANLTLLLHLLPEAELRALQRQCGIHVCPSFAEGFGHSLNEARAAGAVLITTGGPPMDEMVDDGVSGILVPVRPENRQPYHLSTAYRVTADDLAASIRRALALSEEARQAIGLAARARFERERAQFHAQIRAFMEG
jgi:Glycosyl transferases group 1